MAKSKTNEWALTLLRVVLGLIFLYNGYMKLFAIGGFKAAMANFAGWGIPAAGYAALLVGVIEFFGGLFLIIGLLTRYSSLFLLAVMLVAFFVVHIKQGFAASQLVLVLMASLIMIISSGPGKMAFGRALRNKSLH